MRLAAVDERGGDGFAMRLHPAAGRGAAMHAPQLQVQAELPDPPSYSAVRAMLNLLEEKGHLRHEQDGLKYVYLPAVPRHAARKSAMRHLIETFFEGSTEKAVAALLGGESAKLSDEQLDRIADLVGRARSNSGKGGAK